MRRAGVLAILSVALFGLAFLLSVPVAQGSGVGPPNINASLSGVQSDNRISYTLSMENVGQLPAINVQAQAALPNGLRLEDGTSNFSVVFPLLKIGQRIDIGFIALIDSGLPPGTLAVVTANIAYSAPGGTEQYTTSAQHALSVAARGGGVSVIAAIGAIAGGVLLLLGYAWRVHAGGVRIDQLFLLHDSGMLIRHYTNGKGVQRDSDIMSGMLIIVQEFVRDSFNDPRSSLEEVRFGEKRVLMARGEHSIMAAVVTGKRLNGLPNRLQKAVTSFEETHREALNRWNGNLESMDAADVAFRSVLTPKYRGFLPT